MKTMRTDILEIAFEEHGPADGWPMILSHGFPYDVRAYDEVAPMLASSGAHVIVPYLGGFGPTGFLSGSTMRSGQQAALGRDLIGAARRTEDRDGDRRRLRLGWTGLVRRDRPMAGARRRPRVAHQLRRHRRRPARPCVPAEPRMRDVVSRPALVVVAAISSTTAMRSVSGRPRQVCVMWQNRRCSIRFHFDVPGG